MPLPVLHKVTFGAGSTDFYYIKTSDAYVGIKAQTGIEKVADPKGDEEVIPVKELIRTGILWRINIQYVSAGKKKTAGLLVVNGKLSGLFGSVDSDKLENKAYTLNGKAMGTIERISGRRKASFS